MKFHSALTFYLIGFLVTLAGCANKERYLQPNFTYEQAFLPDIAITGVTVNDERSDVKDNAELTDAQKDLIRKEVLKHVGGKSTEYKCTVYVTKGTKTVTGSFKKSVRFAVRMELVHDRKTVRSHAETSYELSYPDSSKEFLDRMYQKVIRESIHNCFVSAIEEKSL